MPLNSKAHAIRLVLAFLMVGGILLAGNPAVAQNPRETDEMTREERLREHERRVREIIEERRQQQLERNKQQEQPPEQAPPEPTPSGLVRLGRVILTNQFRLPETGDRQSDIVVRSGDLMVSDVVLQNEGQTSFDRITVALDYDKRFIRPIRIFDEEIRPYLREEPDLRRIERDSVLVYDARLEKPRVVREMPVLKIVWQAIRPTEHTGVEFVFASGDTDAAPHTAVYQGTQNILGALDDPIDGVLGSSVLVLKPLTEAERRMAAQNEDADGYIRSTNTPEVLQGKATELRRLYLQAVGADVPAGIVIKGPSEPVGVGEPFVVDVILSNPNGAIIDNINFFLKFDPEFLEVVDRDRGNWIKRGINVYDAAFRLDYPFDYHKYNEVDNERGLIRYSMGVSKTLALPSGVFAQVTFLPKKTTAETSVELIAQRHGAYDLTSLETFGYNIMSPNPPLTVPVYQTAIVPESQGKAVAAAEASDETSRDVAEPPSFLYTPGILPTQESVQSKLSQR